MQFNAHGLYDIYGMHYTPFWQTSLFFWCVVSIGGIILAGGIVFFVRWVLKTKKPITLWQHALDRLNEIESSISSDAVSSDTIKQCYFVMTALLKHYIAVRYETAIEYCTDSEFMHYIEVSDFAQDIKQMIKNVYTNVTMVKFADKRTAVTNLKNDVALVRTIICATIPTKKRSTV